MAGRSETDRGGYGDQFEAMRARLHAVQEPSIEESAAALDDAREVAEGHGLVVARG